MGGFDKPRNDSNRGLSRDRNSQSTKNNVRSSGEQRFTTTQGSQGRMSTNSSKSKELNLRNHNRDSANRLSEKQLNNNMRNSQRQSAQSRNSNRQMSSNGTVNRIGSQKSSKTNNRKNESQNLDELKSDITPGSTIVKSQQVSNKGSNDFTNSKEKNTLDKDDSN